MTGFQGLLSRAESWASEGVGDVGKITAWIEGDHLPELRPLCFQSRDGRSSHSLPGFMDFSHLLRFGLS